MQKLKKRLYLLAVIPAALAVCGLITGNMVVREGVAFTGALICLMAILTAREHSRFLWFVTAGLLISIIGDLFLHNHTTDMGFVLGILFFFLAHVCFLTYALTRGKFSWPVFAIILVPYLVFFFVGLMPGPGLKGNAVLTVAALVYLLVSCFSFAAALSGGIRKPKSPARWIFAAGIASLLISDTFISIEDFIQYKGVDFIIMPLYYLSHVLIALSVAVEYTGERKA